MYEVIINNVRISSDKFNKINNMKSFSYLGVLTNNTLDSLRQQLLNDMKDKIVTAIINNATNDVLSETLSAHCRTNGYSSDVIYVPGHLGSLNVSDITNLKNGGSFSSYTNWINSKATLSPFFEVLIAYENAANLVLNIDRFLLDPSIMYCKDSKTLSRGLIFFISDSQVREVRILDDVNNDNLSGSTNHSLWVASPFYKGYEFLTPNLLWRTVTSNNEGYNYERMDLNNKNFAVQFAAMMLDSSNINQPSGSLDIGLLIDELSYNVINSFNNIKDLKNVDLSSKGDFKHLVKELSLLRNSVEHITLLRDVSSEVCFSPHFESKNIKDFLADGAVLYVQPDNCFKLLATSPYSFLEVQNLLYLSDKQFFFSEDNMVDFSGQLPIRIIEQGASTLQDFKGGNRSRYTQVIQDILKSGVKRKYSGLSLFNRDGMARFKSFITDVLVPTGRKNKSTHQNKLKQIKTDLAQLRSNLEHDITQILDELEQVSRQVNLTDEESSQLEKALKELSKVKATMIDAMSDMQVAESMKSAVATQLDFLADLKLVTPIFKVEATLSGGIAYVTNVAREELLDNEPCVVMTEAAANILGLQLTDLPEQLFSIEVESEPTCGKTNKETQMFGPYNVIKVSVLNEHLANFLSSSSEVSENDLEVLRNIINNCSMEINKIQSQCKSIFEKNAAYNVALRKQYLCITQYRKLDSALTYVSSMLDTFSDVEIINLSVQKSKEAKKALDTISTSVVNDGAISNDDAIKILTPEMFECSLYIDEVETSNSDEWFNDNFLLTEQDKIKVELTYENTPLKHCRFSVSDLDVYNIIFATENEGSPLSCLHPAIKNSGYNMLSFSSTAREDLCEETMKDRWVKTINGSEYKFESNGALLNTNKNVKAMLGIPFSHNVIGSKLGWQKTFSYLLNEKKILRSEDLTQEALRDSMISQQSSFNNSLGTFSVKQVSYEDIRATLEKDTCYFYVDYDLIKENYNFTVHYLFSFQYPDNSPQKFCFTDNNARSKFDNDPTHKSDSKYLCELGSCEHYSKCNKHSSWGPKLRVNGKRVVKIPYAGYASFVDNGARKVYAMLPYDLNPSTNDEYNKLARHLYDNIMSSLPSFSDLSVVDLISSFGSYQTEDGTLVSNKYAKFLNFNEQVDTLVTQKFNVIRKAYGDFINQSVKNYKIKKIELRNAVLGLDRTIEFNEEVILTGANAVKELDLSDKDLTFTDGIFNVKIGSLLNCSEAAGEIKVNCCFDYSIDSALISAVIEKVRNNKKHKSSQDGISVRSLAAELIHTSAGWISLAGLLEMATFNKTDINDHLKYMLNNDDIDFHSLIRKAAANHDDVEIRNRLMTSFEEAPQQTKPFKFPVSTVDALKILNAPSDEEVKNIFLTDMDQYLGKYTYNGLNYKGKMVNAYNLNFVKSNIRYAAEIVLNDPVSKNNIQVIIDALQIKRTSGALQNGYMLKPRVNGFQLLNDEYVSTVLVNLDCIIDMLAYSMLINNYTLRVSDDFFIVLNRLNNDDITFSVYLNKL